jgi:hypothetical protein
MAAAKAFLSTGLTSGGTRRTKTIRQQIPRRIHIPVVRSATSRTLPPAYSQQQYLFVDTDHPA